jgi:hypothetical protein
MHSDRGDEVVLTTAETETVLALAARFSVEQEEGCSTAELIAAAQAADIAPEYVHQALTAFKLQQSAPGPLRDTSLGQVSPGKPVRAKWFRGVIRLGVSLAVGAAFGLWSGQSLQGAFSPPASAPPRPLAQMVVGPAFDGLEQALVQLASEQAREPLYLAFGWLRVSSAFTCVALICAWGLLVVAYQSAHSQGQSGAWAFRFWFHPTPRPFLRQVLRLLGIVFYLNLFGALVLTAPAAAIGLILGSVISWQSWILAGLLEGAGTQIALLLMSQTSPARQEAFSLSKDRSSR